MTTVTFSYSVFRRSCLLMSLREHMFGQCWELTLSTVGLKLFPFCRR